MNRRQFLTGVSAAAVASALPAVPMLSHNGIPVAFDLAVGTDRGVLWLIQSTPHNGDHWFRMLYDFDTEHCEEQTAAIEKWFRCYEESEDRLWQPTFHRIRPGGMRR